MFSLSSITSSYSGSAWCSGLGDDAPCCYWWEDDKDLELWSACVSVWASDLRQIQLLVCCDEKLKKQGNSSRKMAAAHHSLFCARMKEVTHPSGIIFPTLISEPSLKFEGFLHKMSPRLLHSTTDYGQPSCFGHLRVQLNVNHRFYCKETIQ